MLLSASSGLQYGGNKMARRSNRALAFYWYLQELMYNRLY